MRYYTKILLPESKRRCKELHEFRGLLQRYFSNTRYEFMVDSPIENEASTSTRAELNRRLHRIRKVFHAAGIRPVLTWTPPPAIGGYAQEIDLILNLFGLFRFQIPPAQVFDVVEQVIGIYESDRRAALWRTLNPLTYIWRLFELVGGIPAAILGLLGFDKSRIEDSRLGRVIRGVIELVTLIATVLTILSYMGWLDVVKAFAIDAFR
jgi:hypothetical protein